MKNEDCCWINEFNNSIHKLKGNVHPRITSLFRAAYAELSLIVEGVEVTSTAWTTWEAHLLKTMAYVELLADGSEMSGRFRPTWFLQLQQYLWRHNEH